MNPTRPVFSINQSFAFFRAIIAEKLVEYMSFKSHYETVGPKEDIPLLEFIERIPREVVLEL